MPDRATYHDGQTDETNVGTVFHQLLRSKRCLDRRFKADAMRERVEDGSAQLGLFARSAAGGGKTGKITHSCLSSDMMGVFFGMNERLRR